MTQAVMSTAILTAPMARLHGALARARGAANLAGWALAAVAVCLACWVAGTALAFGWRPVLIDGSSMSPAIRRGDIAMIEPLADGRNLRPGTVVAFRAGDGGMVTHRIVAKDGQGSYETRGDNNQSADLEPVPPERVVGAGRLIVPALGLPLVWLRGGDVLSLGAAAIGITALVSLQVPRRRGRRSR